MSVITRSAAHRFQAMVPAVVVATAATVGAADLTHYGVTEIPGGAASGMYVARLTESGLIGGTAGFESEGSMSMLPFVGTPGQSLSPMNALNFDQAWGQAFNDAGAVAGYGQFRHADGTVTGTLYRCTPAEGMSEIGQFDGPGGAAFDINDRGDTVGYALRVQGPMNLGRAFFHSTATGMVDLGTFGGYQSMAYDVNNNGLVVGMANVPMNTQRAFAWRDGQLTNLGTLGGTHSTAQFANDADQVFGTADTASDGDRWFIWTQAQGMREFRPRTGTVIHSVFQANSRGDLTGYYSNEVGQVVLFSYTAETGFSDLRNIGQSVSGTIRDINGDGQFISMAIGEGWQSVPKFFAPGQPEQRIDEIDFGLAWPIQNVVSITESGQMLVSGSDNDGIERFAVLTPPSPCLGDIDGDRTIGLSDLAILLGAFGCDGSACAGNLNGDSGTDLTDLATLLGVFGNGCD
ncbi:MAG: DUF3466 family protein [Phycisphaerae bacterium]